MDIINGSFRKKMKPKNADGNGLNVITKIIKNTKRRKANLRFVNQESENKMKQQIPESLRKKLSDAGKKGWLKRVEKAKQESQEQKVETNESK